MRGIKPGKKEDREGGYKTETLSRAFSARHRYCIKSYPIFATPCTVLASVSSLFPLFVLACISVVVSASSLFLESVSFYAFSLFCLSYDPRDRLKTAFCLSPSVHPPPPPVQSVNDMEELEEERQIAQTPEESSRPLTSSGGGARSLDSILAWASKTFGEDAGL